MSWTLIHSLFSGCTLQTCTYSLGKQQARRQSENPGTLSLTSSALMNAGELHCFSKENWGPDQDHRRRKYRYTPLTPSELHATFSPSLSLRGRHCATLDMSRAIRMKNWAALWVPSRRGGFVLYLHKPGGGRAPRSQNKIGFNKARITHNASVNCH